MRERVSLVVVGLFVAAAIAIAVWACGSSGSPAQTPTQPSPAAAAPAPSATYTLAGVVSDAASHRPVQGGTVTVTNGANANKGSSTDGNGYYSIPALVPGSFSIHASATGYAGADQNVTLSSDTRLDLSLQPNAPAPAPAGGCDASLWNHMHDPSRLQMIQPCITVTGVVTLNHTSDDGDVEPPIVPDAPFKNLLNNGNITNLNGALQVEAICQAPPKPDVPDAVRACAGFTGHVPIPPVGAHIRVTGSYTLDKDKGWMEIHPVTSITVIP